MTSHRGSFFFTATEVRSKVDQEQPSLSTLQHFYLLYTVW